jgi:hypothetical protein
VSMLFAMRSICSSGCWRGFAELSLSSFVEMYLIESSGEVSICFLVPVLGTCDLSDMVALQRSYGAATCVEENRRF